MDGDQDDNADYEVGYGRPPAEHQFKAGRPSANPYGRKGRPENRERIAAKRAAKSLRDVSLDVANEKRRVTLADGRSTRMPMKEALLRSAANGGFKNPYVAMRMLERFDREEQAQLEWREQQQLGGPIAIPSTPVTMEDTIRELRAKDDLLRLQDEVRAAREVLVALSTGSEPPSPPVRHAAAASPPPTDAREVRAYSTRVRPRPGESILRADPPIPGTSRKADGTYR